MGSSELKVLVILLSSLVTVCLSDEIRITPTITKVQSLGDLIVNEATSSNVSSQDECAICLSTLDKDDVDKLECKHLFHKHCIKRWLSAVSIDNWYY